MPAVFDSVSKPSALHVQCTLLPAGGTKFELQVLKLNHQQISEFLNTWVFMKLRWDLDNLLEVLESMI